MPKRIRSQLAILFAVLVVGWFGSLEHRGLFFPDEGRYAEIPREMLASGDWTTPRLNDLKYFEKPPLQYWLTALSFAAFGEDEWTARLPSALLGFCALLIVGWTARRLYGVRAGILALAMLGSAWGFYACGQYLTLDMTLSAWLAFALCAFVRAQQAGTDAGSRRNWMRVAWIGVALGTLAKGPIALLIPALALVVYSLSTRDWHVWQRLHHRGGLAIAAAIALPWFVLVQHRNPEFFEFFVFHEHVLRFLEDGHARVGPWWYYIPVLLIGTMPWTPLLAVRATWRSRMDDAHPGFDCDRFCIAWIATIVVFFSLSHSKLPAYVTPVFPALALWACHLPRRAEATALRWCGVVTAIIALIAGGASFELRNWTKFADLGHPAISALPLVNAALIALAVFGACAYVAATRRRLQQATWLLVAGSAVLWAALFAFLHQTDAAFSSERLIEELTGNQKPFQPALPFYSVGVFDPSVPFYLGRPVTLVKSRGELGPGIDAEPDKAIASTEEFRRVWTASSGQAYAAMTPDQYVRFDNAGLPMRRVIGDQRLVVVRRFAIDPEIERLAAVAQLAD